MKENAQHGCCRDWAINCCAACRGFHSQIRIIQKQKFGCHRCCCVSVNWILNLLCLPTLCNMFVRRYTPTYISARIVVWTSSNSHGSRWNSSHRHYFIKIQTRAVTGTMPINICMEQIVISFLPCCVLQRVFRSFVVWLCQNRSISLITVNYLDNMTEIIKIVVIVSLFLQNKGQRMLPKTYF